MKEPSSPDESMTEHPEGAASAHAKYPAPGSPVLPARPRNPKSILPLLLFVMALLALIIFGWQKVTELPVKLVLAYSDGVPMVLKEETLERSHLLPGELIRTGYTLISGNCPRTVISVNSEYYFIMGADTRLTVDAMKKAGTSRDILLRLRMGKGRLWIDNPGCVRVSVETPRALVEPGSGSTEISVSPKGDTRILCWRGEAQFQTLAKKARNPYSMLSPELSPESSPEPGPEQATALGEKEWISIGATKGISPARRVNPSTMDPWQAWSLSIDLPKVRAGELQSPRDAYSALKRQNFKYPSLQGHSSADE
ncbi:MAG: hypothetical protein RDV48_24290 [Candidatus Eremiobacteraeota bacterium]|nr:hypothetical protein [Candidatus Eremiobacteraeota bacterium]